MHFSWVVGPELATVPVATTRMNRFLFPVVMKSIELQFGKKPECELVMPWK